MDINRNSPVPVYYQIQNQFRQKIKNEELIPREKLPSERDLSNKLDISRSTIRKAIRGLISEGLCVKKQGKGIFVSDDKITININHISGTSSFITKMGMDIYTKVIEKKVLSDKKINNILDNEKNELLYLKRVRYINNEPLMLENSYLPLSRYKGLSNEKFDESLYSLLENKYNVKPKVSQGKFDIKLVDEEESKLLNIHLNTGLLVKEVVVFDEENIPMEFSKTSYRSDKFTFAINSEYCV
jgi:GntR family transcriptional regulator